MRLILPAFFLLGYVVTISCNAGKVVQVSDEDIAEVVFRFQIERCYESSPPKVYFLSLKRNNPTDDFMARFKDSKSPVRKRSQMTGEFIDAESGERGIVVSVEKLSSISDTEFKVEGGCVAGGLNGYGFIYSVIRERGTWKVKGSRPTWIS